MNNTGIFIRSYDGDADWLECCLRSIVANTTGFSSLTVVCGDGDAKVIRLAQDHGGSAIVDPFDRMIQRGYVAQQVSKLRADLFTPLLDDYVMFIDSDCVVEQPMTPDILFHEGKPIMLHTPWESCPDALEAHFAEVRNMLGYDPAREFMRRMPLIYPVSVVKAAREWFEAKGVSLLDHANQCGGMSEFNFLGAWAWVHAHDAFHWIDTEKEPWERIPVRQHWSHDRSTMGK